MLSLHFIPFITGRRPTDESRYSGLGSSDNVSLILSTTEDKISTYLLYTIEGDFPESSYLTVSFSMINEEKHLIKVNQPIEPKIFKNDGSLAPLLLKEARGKRLVLQIFPHEDFSSISHLLNFEHLFSCTILVEITLHHQNQILASASMPLFVAKSMQIGSLYQRIIDRIIKIDTTRQGKIDYTYHPWYPVLIIGMQKAALFSNAIIDDVMFKKHHLTDPSWLLRVGLYLEFLTFMGIVESVKENIGDILTPQEREAFSFSSQFIPLRNNLNVELWKKVWKFRSISFPITGLPKFGPVSFLNIFRKEKATLAFLEAHHEDLKNAIMIAGINPYNAQETWQRVYRDAERAVLLCTDQVFPELAFMSPELKEFILWHKSEKGINPNIKKMLLWFFGYPTGLYAYSCNKYCDSLNKVAKWAKKRNLIDYTGDLCIDSSSSLFKAYIENKIDYFHQLQVHDGYLPELGARLNRTEESKYFPDYIADVLKNSQVFASLDKEELYNLALQVRTIMLGPKERIIIQGREGTSLFIVGDGSLDVIYRDKNNKEHEIGHLSKGELFGEIAIFTSYKRTATVRSVESAVIFEIGREQYTPILERHPQVSKILNSLIKQRLANFKSPDNF